MKKYAVWAAIAALALLIICAAFLGVPGETGIVEHQKVTWPDVACNDYLTSSSLAANPPPSDPDDDNDDNAGSTGTDLNAKKDLCCKNVASVLSQSAVASDTYWKGVALSRWLVPLIALVVAVVLGVVVRHLYIRRSNEDWSLFRTLALTFAITAVCASSVILFPQLFHNPSELRTATAPLLRLRHENPALWADGYLKVLNEVLVVDPCTDELKKYRGHGANFEDFGADPNFHKKLGNRSELVDRAKDGAQTVNSVGDLAKAINGDVNNPPKNEPAMYAMVPHLTKGAASRWNWYNRMWYTGSSGVGTWRFMLFVQALCIAVIGVVLAFACTLVYDKFRK